MLRSYLDGRDVLVTLQDIHLVGGRDVKHVNAFAFFARDPQQPFCAPDRRLSVPPHRMGRHVSCLCKGTPLPQPVLVFRMDGTAPVDGLQHGAHMLVIRHQQIAG